MALENSSFAIFQHSLKRVDWDYLRINIYNNIKIIDKKIFLCYIYIGNMCGYDKDGVFWRAYRECTVGVST